MEAARRRHPRSDAGAGEDRVVPQTRRRQSPGDTDVDAISRRAYALASLPPSESPPESSTSPSESPLADTEDESNAAVRLGRLYFGNTSRRRRRHHPALAGGRRAADRGAARARSGHQAHSVRRPPLGRRFQLRDAVGHAGAGRWPCTARRRDGRAQGRGDRRRQAAEDTGRAARPRRQAARQVREVPRRCGLFRIPRRGEARPDRGRPGGDEPGVLRLLSEQRLRRGLPERAPQARLPVHLRLRQHPRRRSNEPDMWEQAKEIARDMLDGKLWLPEIGHSTHYHAYWVHPSWVNEMRKIYKIGVHSFYRPRGHWGDMRVRGAAAQPSRDCSAPSARTTRSGEARRLRSRYRARRRAPAPNASARRTRHSRRRSRRSRRCCRA